MPEFLFYRIIAFGIPGSAGEKGFLIRYLN
jgi:hypothetical protein